MFGGFDLYRRVLSLKLSKISPLFLSLYIYIYICKMSSAVALYTCFLQSSKFKHRAHIVEAPQLSSVTKSCFVAVFGLSTAQISTSI